jgi:hypothetical protein
VEKSKAEMLIASNVVIAKKERIVIDTTFTIAGHSFDLDELSETVHEIENESDIVVTDEKMAAFFEEFEIATKGNMRWLTPAAPGPNFEVFLALVRTALDEG